MSEYNGSSPTYEEEFLMEKRYRKERVNIILNQKLTKIFLGLELSMQYIFTESNNMATVPYKVSEELLELLSLSYKFSLDKIKEDRKYLEELVDELTDNIICLIRYGDEWLEIIYANISSSQVERVTAMLGHICDDEKVYKLILKLVKYKLKYKLTLLNSLTTYSVK